MLEKRFAFLSSNLWQIIRYGAVGTVTSLIYILIAFFGPTLLPVSFVIASVIGYTAAIIFQYFAHARFTFGVNAKDTNMLSRFLSSIAIGYFISTSISAMSELGGWSRALTLIAISIIIPVVNFFLFKLWVFAAPAQKAGLQGDSNG